VAGSLSGSDLLSVKVANALAIAGRDLPGAEVKPLIKTAA